MPIEISLDQPPAGVTLDGALQGESVPVCQKIHLSSEDGNEFIDHLEAIWGYFGGELQRRGIWPSQVDHFLGLVSRENKATLFCNELQQRSLMRAKRSIKAGEPVCKDDIADIEELVFHDNSGTAIEIPNDHGVVLILSVGWRKCLYYDFAVLTPNAPCRPLQISKLFGGFYRHLLFQDVYRITDQQWNRMIEWGWFPFTWMNNDDRAKVIAFSTRQQEPRSLFEEICRSYRAILPQRAEAWQKGNLFADHATFITTALRHYLADDYISSIQVLYPRIEGAMRKLHLLTRPSERTHQRNMVETLVADTDDLSLLLPQRFKAYLMGFYFRAFDEVAGSVPLSRHTVAHGASLPEDYDFVRASLGFMIFDQIFYFLK